MASGSVIDTSKLIIPDAYLPTIYDKITENAVIPTLIPSTPQLYANTDMIYMADEPVAQFVTPTEGGEKGATDFAFDTKPMRKFKVQTTVRVTEDAVWANEDNTATEDQLDYLFTKMGNSLGKAIDGGMIHAFDEFNGATLPDISSQGIDLTSAATKVTATGDLMADMDALPDSVIGAGFNVTGVAFDTMYANALRKLRNNDGLRLYPEIPMRVNTLGSFEGLDAVVSGNVSGRSFKGFSQSLQKNMAIMGDWSMAQWGIIREIALRRFDVGDPDNRGYDLAYKNEVAYRLEMVFAFGIAFPEAFAILRGDAPTSYSLASEESETRAKASSKN